MRPACSSDIVKAPSQPLAEKTIESPLEPSIVQPMDGRAVMRYSCSRRPCAPSMVRVTTLVWSTLPDSTRPDGTRKPSGP